MAENQHNDNLEQFFKANLERYSPVPSDDFWARMEPVIPVKPSFWAGWSSRIGKWVGIGMAVALVVMVLWLWQRDRAQLARLSKTVEKQQLQIERLDGMKLEANPATETRPVLSRPNLNSDAPQSPVSGEPQAAVDEPIFTPKNSTTQPKNEATSFLPRKQNAVNGSTPAAILRELLPVEMIENQSIASQKNPVEAVILSEKTADKQTTTSESEVASMLPIPNFLTTSNMPVLSNSISRSLLVKTHIKRPQNPYPRFSIESGATAFRLPLGRLFQQDTFLSGHTALSGGAGLWLNYDLNSRISVQTGYQFKNLRASRLELRYNSFPLTIKHRWFWSRKVDLEGKAGMSLNSLVSALTDSDGQSVKGLKTTWVGLHGGVAAAWLLNDNLTLVAGPNLGWSLTPMTTGRRSWEMGIGASLRYQL
ncbi:MAG: porin family protein [Saprospiraceae bacterium]|nr:porin family protein [Saprospiraceae bacterium]MCF8251527.1 porin family protein [Saprospiraceae bacterium]MCF8280857.1 porin family protein [Bacteroidales bacterium]MCF8310963.1 porin family protein [Saprospiraceae bacterium]MCF8439701.1 porin family protein [Saprospiraceae bacterium]